MEKGRASRKRNLTVRKRMVLIVAGLVAVTAASGAALWPQSEEASSYRLGRVERGDLVSSVSSSGTLSAVITVQVGSQISGQISELLVDYNDEVHAGQVIARIDPRSFEARVKQAEAELAVAEANLSIQEAAIERAQAGLENAKAELVASAAQVERAKASVESAKRDMERKRQLGERGVIAQSVFDDTVTTHDQALAQLNETKAMQRAQASSIASSEAELQIAQAELINAHAQLRQREAVLEQNRLDLDHTYIRSPVDGVIIDRSVDLGQTVAASLQAPTLFTIAKDLREMQVEVSVDEADIGRVTDGQRAVFSVDTFPSREFEGRVRQIRLSPVTTQNVVTYTVVVDTANSELVLLPGMTANVRVIVEERRDVLKLPNAALRFRPESAGTEASAGAAAAAQGGRSGNRRPPEEVVRDLTERLTLTPDQQEELRTVLEEQRRRMRALRGGGQPDPQMSREVRSRRQQAIVALLTPEQREIYQREIAVRAPGAVRRQQVWLPGGDGPRAVDIMTAISDGTHTAVVGGDLEAGQDVIVGVNRPAAESRSGGLRFFR